MCGGHRRSVQNSNISIVEYAENSSQNPSYSKNTDTFHSTICPCRRFLPARPKFALIPRRGFLAPCGKFPPILPFGDFSHRAGNFRRSSFSGISPRVREISADPACRRFLADTAGLVSSNLYQTYNTILHSSKTCSLSSHLHSRANNTVGIPHPPYPPPPQIA